MLQVKAEFKKGVCPQNKKLTADKCHVLCHRLIFYLKNVHTKWKGKKSDQDAPLWSGLLICWGIIYEPAW